MYENFKFDVTAIGELLIDFTFVGKNDAGQNLFAQNPGGAPANVLTQIQKLGGKTAFIGKVGNDMHGAFLKSVLDAQNINTQGLVFDDRYFTTLAFVNIDSNGERTFSFARKPGADTCLEEAEIDFSLLNNTKIFHTGSLSLTDEPSRSAVYSAVKYAKANDCLISYDPNYRASLWEDEGPAIYYMRSLIPFADLMKISEEEAFLLSGNSDIEKSAEILFKQGVKVVAVTLGAKGCYIYNKMGGKYVNSSKSDFVIDTTGAGDSFWGAFLFSILQLKRNIDEISLEQLSKCADFANAAASLCIEKQGAIPAMPDMYSIKLRLKNRVL